MIEVKKLCKAYDGKNVLNELSCTFEHGKTHTLIAPNGSGKTTLISILSGLLIPSSGDVVYTEGDSLKNTYVVLAGEKNLYAKNTVKENAEYVGRIKGRTGKEIKEITEFLKQRFPIYNELFNKVVEKLSFGQKRMVSLLNAAVSGSSCIIMDEVSEGLDIDHVALLIDMINYLKSDRIMILASHDYDFVADISDVSMFIKDGFVHETLGRVSKDELVNKYFELYGGKEA